LALKLMTGNEALALGALHAGIKVATGYPGTPSTGALASLLEMQPAGVHVEWSTNEKVAFEIAAAAAWAGQRALCAMKMSGLNVAYDSLISTAHSGVIGGLVIYVADDPGANAGMVEQDSRGFALMSDLPMLDPVSVQDAYDLTRIAFDLSEAIGSPVFVRLVTANASSFSAVDLPDEPSAWPERQPLLIRDINVYTKAGAVIAMTQHRDVMARLEKAEKWIAERGLNELRIRDQGPGIRDQEATTSGRARRGMSSEQPSIPSPQSLVPSALGIITVGIVAAYLDEAFEIASRYGVDPATASVLRIISVHPLPTVQIRTLLQHCDTILVLEELEPTTEYAVYIEAQRMGWDGRIIGKLSGHFERVGEYGVRHIVQGLAAALDLAVPTDLFRGHSEVEKLAAARPITVCAGCPHRGTFMAINQAVRRAGFKKDEVMVTGDIGCTILGMNPPFNTVWNEISMGASIGMAMGFVHAGVKTPVIATIGDSTFYHAGLPALVNAVQHQTPITLIIMDNGWTSMTGMQINPGTCEQFQGAGHARLDIARIVPALGVDQFWIVDPFEMDDMARVLQAALKLPGVKVLLARQECAIPAKRRGVEAGEIQVIDEKCNQCKLCITVTGCLAITLSESSINIDPEQCYACGLCAAVCNRDAIEFERAADRNR
jgi:indolepyruvate ferredoxin oxidoreductase, alpha subunit